jgi:8-amino-7-oxononanoate synthase
MPKPHDAVEAFAAARLRELEAAGIRRGLRPTTRLDHGRAETAGRPLISFCDNDYLGLSRHPKVIEAAVQATREYGAGAGAARLVSGDCPLNGRLEAKLAAKKQLPAARVFGSGYLASIGTLPVLVGRGDLIVLDALSHSCLRSGARLSGAEVRQFAHNDAEAAREALAGPHPRKLLVTETVFSMDGDLAPLAELSAACEAEGAWLVTDDAHGFGVLDLDNPAPIQLGTLSKSAGAYGGYVAGPAALVDLLASRARSFVYATGLPPPVLAAALAALDAMEAEPGLGASARGHAALFCRELGLPCPAAAIAPLVLGDVDRAMAASAELERRGYLVPAIRPPTVPEGTARLRFTFSAAHSEDDVAGLVAAVRSVIA